MSSKAAGAFPRVDHQHPEPVLERAFSLVLVDDFYEAGLTLVGHPEDKRGAAPPFDHGAVRASPGIGIDQCSSSQPGFFTMNSLR